MKACGIIAEYNPFHNGHKFQIDYIRSNGFSHIVAVMSGNFVQRGDVAIADKWSRTQMALQNGCDVVIELPTCYAVSPAEKFAYGAVQTLKQTGVINALCFGSESGDISGLTRICACLEDDKTNELIKQNLSSGITYAAARQNALTKVLGEQFTKILQSPNDVLGIEYIKAIRKLECDFTPFPIKRHGCEHDSNTANGEFASASYLRKRLLKKEVLTGFLPEKAGTILENEVVNGRAPSSLYNAKRAVLWQLRRMNEDDFLALCDVSEGLNNRLYDAVKNAVTLDELYTLVKTKRYTLSRIKRLVLCAALGINDYTLPPYIRVLGFTKNGEEVLKEMKKKSPQPIVTSFSDCSKISEEATSYFKSEALYTDFYALTMPDPAKAGEEFTKSVLKI